MQFDAFVDFGISVGAIDIHVNWILPRNELCHYCIVYYQEPYSS